MSWTLNPNATSAVTVVWVTWVAFFPRPTVLVATWHEAVNSMFSNETKPGESGALNTAYDRTSSKHWDP